MIKKLLTIAALCFPSVAHAELLVKKSSEARPSAKVETLSVDGMLAKINTTYMQGMQRCYIKGLSQDNGLEGQATIVFTVNSWGRVTGTVSGIAPKVDACLTNQLATWRFPAARDHKDRPTVATFKLNVQLAPRL